MSDFNPLEDKIAVVVKDFTLKKKGEGWFNKYSEPYIISMAIDQSGANNPAIDCNIQPYPKVKKDELVSFDGVGHLVYGPKNPGEFLVYSVTFMESDQDIRTAANTIEGIIKSEAIKIGAKALLVANPTYSTAVQLIGKIGSVVIDCMKKNKDDELFKRNGTLLRGTVPAYNIKETFPSENAFIKTNIAVMPLISANSIVDNSKKITLE